MTIFDKEIFRQKFNSFWENVKNNVFVSGKEQIPDTRNSSKLPQHKATKLPSEFEPKSSRYLLLNCLTKKHKRTMELIKYTKRNSIRFCKIFYMYMKIKLKRDFIVRIKNNIYKEPFYFSYSNITITFFIFSS